MVSGTLYTYSGSFRANKILIAAAYSGSNVTIPDFEYGKTNNTTEFKKKFPLGKVPCFESDGLCLSESDAIAQYVSNEALLGGDNAASRAAVREYVSFTESEIVPSACTWVFPTMGWTQYNKKEADEAMNHIRNCFQKLDEILLTKTFLVGERVTLADITLSTALAMLYVQVLDGNFRSAFGNVNRWFLTCVNQPQFKKVLGDIKLCEKMAVFNKKVYDEIHSKKGKDKTPKEEKKPEPKQPEPKKVEKVDIFADVPKSDFILDAWKKIYQNSSIPESQKYFEDNFDDKAFSVWYGEKDPEITKDFMVESYVEGMKERFGSLRKHVHMIIITIELEKNKYQVVTALIAKGTTLIFDRNDDWTNDSCYFKWTKIETEERKKFFETTFYGATARDGTKSIDSNLYL